MKPLAIKKILVIALNNVGDVILNTAVISLLRDHFPSSHLGVLVGTRGEPVLRGSRTIDRIFLYNKRASLWKKVRLVANLRKEKFDLVVDLKNTSIPFLLGARYRTPLGLDRSLPLMREQHLSRLKFLMPVTFEERNRFDFFSADEEHSAFEKLKQRMGPKSISDFIVIALGARMGLKRWTISGFSETARYFISRGRTIVIVGGVDDSWLVSEMERRVRFPIVNLVSLLTLRELAALVYHASLVLANDSALLHLALELDRPAVGLFGPTDEAKCGRRGARFKKIRLLLNCAPCELTQCKLERRICLDDLSADQVIRSCEELLNGTFH